MFSSDAQLCQCTTGPADDLLALGYLWLWMLRGGHLPWRSQSDFSDDSAPLSSGVATLPRSSSVDTGRVTSREIT